jgi:hypothetical protein
VDEEPAAHGALIMGESVGHSGSVATNTPRRLRTTQLPKTLKTIPKSEDPRNFDSLGPIRPRSRASRKPWNLSALVKQWEYLHKGANRFGGSGWAIGRDFTELMKNPGGALSRPSMEWTLGSLPLRLYGYR